MKKNMIMLTFILMYSLGILTSCSSPEISERRVNIIPAPAMLEMDEGIFSMDQESTIAYSDESLKDLAEELSACIKNLTGINMTIDHSISPSLKDRIYLQLTDDSQAFSDLPTPLGVSAKSSNPMDENYSLSITNKGVLINAAAPEGIYRGITSFKQLIGGNMEAKAEKVYLPTIEIKDSPRYAWRGLSLDVSRCFFTVDEVKQVIDMAALYKVNVLHMHLTDNQGWRIEIKKHPLLTEIGSQMPNNGRPGGYYTQEQFTEIVKYAKDHFITIVPEIDIPGHTSAVFASYPEFKNAVKKNVAMNIPGQALGALDADDGKAMAFVEDVITELVALTPGSYIHIGGDETFGLPDHKFTPFVNKARQMVLDSGKKMVGWQETARADISEGDVFQHWIHFQGNLADMKDSISAKIPEKLADLLIETFSKAAQDLEKGISKNAKVLLSPSNFVYLDHRYLEPSADSTQTAEQDRLGMTAYPKQTIQQMYDWDPATLYPILNQEKDVAGVEAAIWCETITNFKDLQFLLMPRLSGVAEKGWSEAKNTNWDEYKVRLSSHAPMWDQMKWYYFKSSLIDWK